MPRAYLGVYGVKTSRYKILSTICQRKKFFYNCMGNQVSILRKEGNQAGNFWLIISLRLGMMEKQSYYTG